jgi:hypothetical protein
MKSQPIWLRILLLAVVAGQVFLTAQVKTARPEVDESSSKTLAERYSGTSLPDDKDRNGVDAQIAKARPEDISSVLSSVVRTLSHPDEKVRVAAANDLLAITTRDDSAALLESHINEISKLLFASDTLMQKVALWAFGTLKPAPPAGVIAPLVKLLKQTDRNPNLYTAAISVLVSSYPENPDVVGAVADFMSRPLASNTRLDTLSALQHSLEKNTRIVSKVADMLDGQDKDVKLEAIKTLKGMGKDALLQAQPKLQQLAQVPEEAPEVKAEAKKALKAISE